LTHEVAYGGLLQERRRVLHGRIVEALEALAAERLAEQVDRLAHHAVRGEVWDKALAYCRQAGTRAAARSAHHEAVVYFEQALAALAQLPEQRDTLEQAIDVRLDLHRTLVPLGEEARIFDNLRTAEALAERLGDDRRLGRIASDLGIHFSAMGEHDCAITSGQRALALATTSGAFDVQVRAQTQLSQAYYTGGDFRQALDVARWAMAVLTGDLRYTNFGLLTLPAVGSRIYGAGCLAELGGFAEGSGVAEDAVQIAEAVEQPFNITSALLLVGLCYRRQGDIRQAIPALERSLALCQTTNIPRLFPMAASFLSAAYALAGRAAEARLLLDQTLERVAAGRRVIFHALVLVELSEALLLVGRVEEARTLAGRLLELYGTHTGRGYQAHAYRLLGEAAAHGDPPEAEQADAYYRQALALADELGMRPLQAHCHLGLGTLYATTGQRERARIALTAAIALYRAMDMTFWLPQAETVLAQVE
jgi:tetratricopeptide (TPR) repeat protein